MHIYIIEYFAAIKKDDMDLCIPRWRNVHNTVLMDIQEQSVWQELMFKHKQRKLCLHICTCAHKKGVDVNTACCEDLAA